MEVMKVYGQFQQSTNPSGSQLESNNPTGRQLQQGRFSHITLEQTGIETCIFSVANWRFESFKRAHPGPLTPPGS